MAEAQQVIDEGVARAASVSSGISVAWRLAITWTRRQGLVPKVALVHQKAICAGEASSAYIAADIAAEFVQVGH